MNVRAAAPTSPPPLLRRARSRLLSAALAGLLTGIPTVALAAQQGAVASGPASKNPYLNAGIRLYNELEFTEALNQLKKAESFAGNSVNDEVLIHVYEGIVQFENNKRDEAETQFKTALALNIKAQLPKKISPKTVALFEKVRQELLASQPEVVPNAPDVPAADKPTATTSTPNAGGLTRKPAEASGPPVAPWVALGTGVVLAGAGGFFALRGHSLGNDANGAHFQDDANKSLSDAKTSATIGYVALGAAAVATATFAVLYLLDKPSGEAAKDSAH